MGCGAPHPTGKLSTEASETAVQTARRLAAAQQGNRLWRNNVGALPDERGIPVRYGLANDSAKTNKVFKSSDLIGITRRIITPDMVGCLIGQFTAEETKKPGWSYQGDKPCGCKPGKSQCNPCHERAQLAFINQVIALGGIARFVSNGEGI